MIAPNMEKTRSYNLNFGDNLLSDDARILHTNNT